MGKLAFIDAAIVAVYLITCLVIGFYKSGKIKSIREYAVGNRNFSTLVIVSTLFATYVSAGRIGEMEGVFKYGILYGLPLLFAPFNWLIVKSLYAKNIGQFIGCISISEIMEKLYGRVGLHITSIISIIFAIGILAVQVTALGFLFKHFFSISYFNGVLLGMGVIVLYSAFGGIRAVVLTDVLQFFVFIILLPLVAGLAFYKAGSYENIIQSLPDAHLTIFDDNDSLLTFFGFIFWMVAPAITAPFCQRLLMAKNKKQLLTSYNLIITVYIFFSLVLFVLGFSMKILYPNIESKMSFYHFIGDLPQVIVGLMVTSVLAIIMSSADSWLNTISVIFAHDIIKKLVPSLSSRSELLIAKYSTFLSAIIAILIAFKGQSILELMLSIENFSYSVLLVPLTAGFLRFRTNQTSFIISAILGLSGCFAARIVSGEFGVKGLMLGAATSSIGFFGAHYWQFPHELSSLQSKVFKQLYRIKENILATPSRLIYKVTHFSITSNNNKKNSYFLGFTFFFVLLNVPIFMFGIGGISNESMILRVIASALCILMCLSEMCLNNKNREWLSYISITFCLPFLGIYSYLASGYELVWLINMLVSLILFFILMPKSNAILFSIIGCLLGYGLQSYNGDIIVGNHNIIGQYSSIILTTLLLITLYHINQQIKHEKAILKTLGQTIAHDVGGPLSMGLISTELIGRLIKKKEYGLTKKCIEELRESMILGMQDVQVMLNVISTDTMNQPEDWGKYSLTKYVKDAVGNYHMSDHQRSRVLLDIEEEYEFIGSPTLVRHVINNLLSNAFKYAGEQANIKVYIKSHVRRMHEEEYITLHIKDDGYGISDKIKDRLFESYVSTGGHGIGLNFCIEAMRLMNGEIECISEEKKGTEFILSFNNSERYRKRY